MAFLSTATRFLLTFALLTVIGFGIHDYLHNIDVNDCRMTRMMSPIYIPIMLDKKIRDAFPRYTLYFQCNTWECRENGYIDFSQANHIPALFITGNADSHQIVRSIASVALTKSEQPKYANQHINFDYFTICFNEELNALYGPVLKEQTKFIQHSIKHILGLYKSVKPENKKPKTVLIVGNSMGGLLARGVFANGDPSFDASKYINTIITQATPHVAPVVSADSSIRGYYDSTNRYWLNSTEKRLENLILVSVFGGNRDILVRNSLAEFDESWKTSRATIISKLTTAIPYVWRSTDHKCIAWCNELVLVINRALFSLIDRKTGQVFEDKNVRERILRHYFESDKYELHVSDKNTALKYPAENVIKIEKNDEIYLNINAYNYKQETIYAFDTDSLKSHFEKNNLDGLFIYTNLNRYQTFFACEQLLLDSDGKNYECVGSTDLYKKYGNAIPPNELGRTVGLKTLHIEDLNSLINSNRYILIKFPLWKRSDIYSHQAILKLDWYSSRDRIQNISAPGVIDVQDVNKNGVFYRFYMPNFRYTYQAFYLKHHLSSDSCNKQLSKAKSKLMSSSVQVKFTESSNQFYYSQIIPTNEVNITLRLSKNIVANNVPHLDLINFDVKQLITFDEKSTPLDVKCNNGHQLSVEIAPMAILGQIIRFYVLLLPAFLVAQFQFIDYLNLAFKSKTKDEIKREYLVLNKYQVKFGTHIIYCVLLTIVCQVIAMLNETILFDLLPKNDIAKLISQNTWVILLVPTLYAFSYAIVSLITFVFSILFTIMSYFMQKIASKIIGLFIKYSIVSHLIFIFYFIFSICVGILSSTFVLCCIFYGELVYLATKNPNINKSASFSALNSFSIDLTRLLLFHILVVLKMPALLIWTKSLIVQDFQPLFMIIGDPDLEFAVYSLVIYELVYLKRNSLRIKQSLRLNHKLLSKLVMVNCLITVIYASLSLQYLPYFLLIHLILMLLFNEDEINLNQIENDKKRN